MNIALIPLSETPLDSDLALKWSLEMWHSNSIPSFSKESWSNFYERGKSADFYKWVGDGQELVFIAKCGEEVVGTSALVDSDDLEEYRHLSPWVAAFIVKSGLRGGGLGTEILAALEVKAESLGIVTLYLWTEDRAEFYLKRGYEYLTSGSLGRLSYDLLKKELTSHPTIVHGNS